MVLVLACRPDWRLVPEWLLLLSGTAEPLRVDVAGGIVLLLCPWFVMSESCWELCCEGVDDCTPQTRLWGETGTTDCAIGDAGDQETHAVMGW